MNYERKTKKDLIAKLEGLRGEVAEKDATDEVAGSLIDSLRRS